MRYPHDLKDGGTIGFCAPSFGCATEPYKSRLKSAFRYFRKLGYSLEKGPNVYAGKGVGISNKPESCGRELTEIYCSPSSDAVMSVGGGELMCEILDHVDWERIREAEPKWFMGLSDNTNFTFLLTTLCDTASVYGPCAPSFGCRPLHRSITEALQILRGEIGEVGNYDSWTRPESENEYPLASFDCTEPFSPVLYGAGGKRVRSVRTEGRLIGGCLDILAHLAGTCYDRVPEFCERYKDDGILWFLETCDLNTMETRRALWELKHAGWFKYARGFLFGRPFLIDDCALGLEWEDAVLEHLRDLDVPVVRDLDIGHLPPYMPLICGSYAKAEATETKARIVFEKR